MKEQLVCLCIYLFGLLLALTIALLRVVLP